MTSWWWHCTSLAWCWSCWVCESWPEGHTSVENQQSQFMCDRNPKASTIPKPSPFLLVLTVLTIISPEPSHHPTIPPSHGIPVAGRYRSSPPRSPRRMGTASCLPRCHSAGCHRCRWPSRVRGSSKVMIPKSTAGAILSHGLWYIFNVMTWMSWVTSILGKHP